MKDMFRVRHDSAPCFELGLNQGNQNMFAKHGLAVMFFQCHGFMNILFARTTMKSCAGFMFSRGHHEMKDMFRVRHVSDHCFELVLN